MKLTPKQEKFANLYVELGNASEAYRQAYDVGVNTKSKSINEASSKLLKDPNIHSRVEEIRNALRNDYKIDREWIIEQHKEIIDWYKELKALAKRDNLSKEDKSRVFMLKDLIKGSDYRGSLDSITKMLGLNAPEKIETKDTSHNTEWG